ncbi:MAG: hypothetical protein AB1Z98_01150 [Nannocystaceae bacterium]
MHEPHSVPHGEGSLAHRDLLSLTAPPSLPPLSSAPWRPLPRPEPASLAPRRRTPETTRARGPPSGRPLASLALA